MRWIGREFEAERMRRSRLRRSLNGRPKKRRPRDAGDAVRAAGEALPVEQHEADDLAEGERDDGEIVAAQPQHREAEQDAPERGEDAGERQADPERQAEVLRQQRVGIGADRVERDIAEVEQAGEADHDVEAPAEHHIGEHQDAEVEQVAVVVEQRPGGAARSRAGRAPTESRQRRSNAPAASSGAERPQVRAGSGSSAEKQRAQEAADEHRRATSDQPASSQRAGRRSSAPVGPCIGVARPIDQARTARAR